VTEPFDSNAFLRLLDQLNIDHAHFDGDMSRHIARIVASLSPEDRRVFADAVLSMPPGPLG
jgi:hypothetical protein